MSFFPCCRDAMALLTEASEGALTGGERLKFVVHMGICPTCKRYRSQLERSVSVLRSVTAAPAEPAAIDAVMQHLLTSAPDDDDDDD